MGEKMGASSYGKGDCGGSHGDYHAMCHGDLDSASPGTHPPPAPPSTGIGSGIKHGLTYNVRKIKSSGGKGTSGWAKWRASKGK